MHVAKAVAAAGSSVLLGSFVAGAAAAGPTVSQVAAPPAVLVRPDIVHLHSALQGPPSTGFCEKHFKIACYTAKQIQTAFNLPPLYKAGVSDKGSHLAAPPKLTIIQPAGKVAPYKANDNREGWAGETDLDVEYAHAIAPGANILLVETPTSENEGTTGFPQIVTAEKFVISHHLGGVISQSFSATEQTFTTKASLLDLRGAYTAAAAAGVTVLAASGDSGAADTKFNGSTYYLHPVTSWPDSDPLVTGVGGTQLHLAAAGRPGPATVWNDTYNA